MLKSNVICNMKKSRREKALKNAIKRDEDLMRKFITDVVDSRYPRTKNTGDRHFDIKFLDAGVKYKNEKQRTVAVKPYQELYFNTAVKAVLDAIDDNDVEGKARYSEGFGKFRSEPFHFPKIVRAYENRWRRPAAAQHALLDARLKAKGKKACSLDTYIKRIEQQRGIWGRTFLGFPTSYIPVRDWDDVSKDEKKAGAKLDLIVGHFPSLQNGEAAYWERFGKGTPIIAFEEGEYTSGWSLKQAVYHEVAHHFGLDHDKVLENTKRNAKFDTSDTVMSYKGEIDDSGFPVKEKFNGLRPMDDLVLTELYQDVALDLFNEKDFTLPTFKNWTC